MPVSQTRETLANDIWRACDILRRDNNCGGIMEYIEHLAWLLFLRFLDAQEEEWETQASLEGRAYDRILDESLETLKHPPRPNGAPPYWDGHAAERIIGILDAYRQSKALTPA